MTGEIIDLGEGLGDLATGGVVARAVEPKHGDAGGHSHESACLNCGTALVGSHCHSCGQRAHVHRTLGAFFHDLLHGVLHFEGKTWRTLPRLVWKPGQLTREYIEGKRARYVSPIALFLFVVFLSFALFSMLGGSEAFAPGMSGLDQVKGAYATNEEQLAELRERRTRVLDDPKELADVDRKIASLEEDQRGLSMVLGGVGDEFETEFRKGFERSPLPAGSTLAKALDEVTSNPQLAIYKVQTNAYKFSWALIPLSVPFVWMLFPFSRRFSGYDHTVFTTYSITFMIALVAVCSLFFFYDMPAIGGLLLLYAPLHLYRHLRGTYDLGRWGAFWRMTMLSVFAWIAIGLFVTLITWLASGE